jgi:hypothetical protein
MPNPAMLTIRAAGRSSDRPAGSVGPGLAVGKRDARPEGRAAGPRAEPPHYTSTEVDRVHALSASDRLGDTDMCGGPELRSPI